MGTDPVDLPAVGLTAGTRYRCASCGNLTRFDVEITERVQRFWHADLAGGGMIEQTARLTSTVERVTCRWCGSADHVQVEPSPGS